MSSTQLLLIQDVEDLGRSGEIVKVKPGYARNYLIPQGLAVAATKGNLSRQKRLQEEREKRAVVDRQESEHLSERLRAVELAITVKVDHEGHMYGSVAAQDIVELLQNQENIILERKAVLTRPIKRSGTHTIAIKLKEGVMGELKLMINPDIQLTAPKGNE